MIVFKHKVNIDGVVLPDDDHEKCVAYAEWIDSMLDDEDGVRHEDEFHMLKRQMIEDGTYYAYTRKTIARPEGEGALRIR